MTAIAVSTGPRSMRSESLAVSSAHWLHVVSHTDPRYGGLSAAVPALADSLAATPGVDTSLAAFCAPGESYLPPVLDRDHVTFWPTSRRQWLFDRTLRDRFTAVVRGADGLHIHGIWEESTARAAALARELRKPYVLSAHGMLEPWALSAKRVKKQIYAALIEHGNVRRASCLHALTEAEAQQYRAFGARGPIAVIPNAVQIPDDVHGEEFLAHFPELRGKRLLLFMSRLHPKKGVDLLLRSWIETARRFPEAHLVLAGPDSDGMRAHLLAEAQNAGIDDRLTFAGMLTGSKKWSALDAAEAYILPSHSEGLSMALLEAMGVGLPVIATHACNMPEITRSGAGWEIDTTTEAISEAISAVLERPMEDNWATGRRGAQLIAERYTPRQVAEQFRKVYGFVLGGPRPEGVTFLDGGRV